MKKTKPMKKQKEIKVNLKGLSKDKAVMFVLERMANGMNELDNRVNELEDYVKLNLGSRNATYIN